MLLHLILCLELRLRINLDRCSRMRTLDSTAGVRLLDAHLAAICIPCSPQQSYDFTPAQMGVEVHH